MGSAAAGPDARRTRTTAQEDSMRPKTLAAWILIAAGILALAYQGITYTTRGKTVDVGPVHVTTERSHTIPIAPIGGALVLAGGVVLLLMDGKRFSRAA